MTVDVPALVFTTFRDAWLVCGPDRRFMFVPLVHVATILTKQCFYESHTEMHVIIIIVIHQESVSF